MSKMNIHLERKKIRNTDLIYISQSKLQKFRLDLTNQYHWAQIRLKVNTIKPIEVVLRSFYVRFNYYVIIIILTVVYCLHAFNLIF